MRKFNFVKKLVVVASVLVMGTSVLACGGNGEDGKATQGATEAQVTAKYAFETAGTIVTVNAKAEEVVAKLGNPTKFYEEDSCAFTGKDKYWYYNGYTIQGYQKDGVDYVYSISFTDDTVKTREGLRIGDAADKVKSTYGDVQDKGGMYIYEADGMQLIIGTKNNAITTISYALK